MQNSTEGVVNERPAPSIRVPVIIASACLAVAIASVSYVWNDGVERISVLEGLTSGLAVSLAECRTSREDHFEQFTEVKSDVFGLQNSVRDLEKSISAKREKIAHITAAKELEARIMEQVRWVRNRIDGIESDVKALDDALHAAQRKLDKVNL
jgi:chromosome segregation ATPase